MALVPRLFTRLFFVSVILVCSGIAHAQPAGYGYGKQITVDATEVIGGSALANFPVMVRFMGAGADDDL
ncbi:MAG: hypothetical protein O2887_06240 [Bacteroidetes bacterium]|nr:hypothetical protein [Bacteroidota bacterium]MDA1120081.1 hypothetical protein [Bacteroidota bacterium]